MTISAKQKRIILVDSDRDFLSELATFLSQFDYDIQETDKGTEVLKIIDDSPTDLVIADMNLPDLPGMSLLKSIRNVHPQLPVIIHSKNAQMEAAIECLRCGATDFIVKPFKNSEIEQKIKEIFESGNPHLVKSICQDEEGRILGGYKVIRTLGEGNQATVFLCEKTIDGKKRRFALKILKAGQLAAENASKFVERFVQEAEAATRVTHPNIVGVVEYGAADEENVPFIVMEYVAGQSLRDYIDSDDQLNYRRKAQIVRDIADALAAVHAAGICHRDIKPDNIIIDEDDTAKLTDFGIARLPESDLTLARDLLGTPSYLSPEGFISAKVDHRADIFSLGVTAYELFLREQPFPGRTVAAVACAIRGSRPKDPAKITKDFPTSLQTILARMLKKKPADRYQSAAELVAELDAYLDGKRSKIFSGFLNARSSGIGNELE